MAFRTLTGLGGGLVDFFSVAVVSFQGFILTF